MARPRRLPRGALAGAAFALAAAVLSTTAPRAHEGAATAYAAITVSGSTVRYRLVLPGLPPGPLANRIRPADPALRPDYAPLVSAVERLLELRIAGGGRCEAASGRVTPPPAGGVNITTVVDFACPAPMRELLIVDNLFQVLGDDLHTLASIDTPGGSRQLVFATESRQARIVIDGEPAAAAGGRGFVTLGAGSMLTGAGHLLLLVALLVGGAGLRGLALLIVGFAIGHSASVALAASGIVSLPRPLVESLIALSVVYVAAENLFPRLAWSRRWAVGLVFGLVHGLGLARVLVELALPPEELPRALLGFNAGVELGVAAVLAAVLPVVWWSKGQGQRPWLATPVSVVLLAAGVGLLVAAFVDGG